MASLDAWLREGPLPWPERMTAQRNLARCLVEGAMDPRPEDPEAHYVACTVTQGEYAIIANFDRDDPRHAGMFWAKAPKSWGLKP